MWQGCGNDGTRSRSERCHSRVVRCLTRSTRGLGTLYLYFQSSRAESGDDSRHHFHGGNRKVQVASEDLCLMMVAGDECGADEGAAWLPRHSPSTPPQLVLCAVSLVYACVRLWPGSRYLACFGRHCPGWGIPPARCARRRVRRVLSRGLGRELLVGR